jgi:dihydrofolate reductase
LEIELASAPALSGSDPVLELKVGEPILSLVVAVAENGVIGRENALPWRLPADLAHFKRLTLDQTIVMGRRTWESLPGLLPRRRHILLSRDPNFRAEGCLVVDSLDAAVTGAGDVSELMIIGGAALYREALPRASRLYLTRVHAWVEGNVRFPGWNPAQWRELSRVEHAADASNPFAMTFLELQRCTNQSRT